MRRARVLMAGALLVVGVGTAFVPAAAGPATDYTGPYGPFGFTTQGLGATPNYGEPSLALAPDGRHVAISTPGGGGVSYWLSANDGNSFTTNTTTSPNGGGDSALDFLPDGTLLSADLEVTDSNVKISHDYGKTFDAGRSAGTEQDRQWLGHSPDGKTTYLVYHDFVAEAEFIAVSKDAGKTWTTSPADQILVNSPDQVTAPGAAIGPTAGSSASLVDQGVNTFSGPILVDPDGKDLYVVYSISDLQSNANPTVGVPPFGPVHGLVVAHSADAGKTWTNKYAVVAKPDPTDPSKEEQTGTLFPWGFLDPAGNVYVVFNDNRGNVGTDKFHTYYAYSTDKGAHWSAPIKLDDLPISGPGSTVYNTGAAVSPGVIDLAWYESPNGVPSSDKSVYTPHFAQVRAADTAHPTITSQALSALPNHRGGICLQGILCGVGPGSSDRSLLDFFELAVNPRTHLAGIAYADNARLPAKNGSVTGEVVYASQTKTFTPLPITGTTGTTTPTMTAKGAPGTAPAASRGALAMTGLSTAVPLTAFVLLIAGGYGLRRRRGIGRTPDA
ncbi:MAG TPA: sialidase family protein [Mycobacteriales bacterium]|nr:sialidase family protein [Mycobacteriales bacterium]